ncbi:hypothetical protein THAOC_21412, partial [Thalassiosira oceanica]
AAQATDEDRHCAASTPRRPPQSHAHKRKEDRDRAEERVRRPQVGCASRAQSRARLGRAGTEEGRGDRRRQSAEPRRQNAERASHRAAHFLPASNYPDEIENLMEGRAKPALGAPHHVSYGLLRPMVIGRRQALKNILTTLNKLSGSPGSMRLLTF